MDVVVVIFVDVIVSVVVASFVLAEVFVSYFVVVGPVIVTNVSCTNVQLGPYLLFLIFFIDRVRGGEGLI